MTPSITRCAVNAAALSIIASGLLSCSTSEVEEIGGCQFPKSISDYTLVWQDEFDGGAIDTTKWSYDLEDGCQPPYNNCRWGNNELQYYTNRSENAQIVDGSLVITAKRETPTFENYEYTSARMVTRYKGDWKYGRIEVRAKMPIGQGLWPAVWMLPTDSAYGGWPKSGEIDIMEYLGHEPRKTLGTIHYGHDFHRFDSQEYNLPPGDETFANEYHVFTALWNENCIQFLVDGNEIGEPNTRSTVLPTTYPFDQRFHLLLNLAVGGNLPGNPNAATVFPQQFSIDYVRVYQ